ncbi:MAG: bis-aminopropyl spermidine synthase family protein [Deltaproteobacteria bacterium]|nr:bis-aminopropyl spermidine synthase family protein [Deltaproteobacteria bacterium]
MNEGIFRALRALAAAPPPEEREWARRSGEAVSVLRETLRRHPRFILEEHRSFRLTRDGELALGLEMCARGKALPSSPDDPALPAFEALVENRPDARRELDQIHATADTSLRRARLLVERGDVQRGLCLLGDDDLVSLALPCVGVEHRTTLVDVDARLLSFVTDHAAARELDVRGVQHDLREPMPRKLTGRFGCVFTDPPYAIEGFRLFISRAIELMKPDGRLWVAFGQSRRAAERGLEKQRALLEAGLVLLDMLPDFNAYEAGESIGARSDLYLFGRTPKTRPLVTGRVEGPLYSSRKPNT